MVRGSKAYFTSNFLGLRGVEPAGGTLKAGHSVMAAQLLKQFVMQTLKYTKEICSYSSDQPRFPRAEIIQREAQSLA